MKKLTLFGVTALALANGERIPCFSREEMYYLL